MVGTGGTGGASGAGGNGRCGAGGESGSGGNGRSGQLGQLGRLGRQVVMATGNQGKLVEIRRLLDGTDVLIVPQSEFDFEPAEETGTTFLENALLKARCAADATGLLAIADDSGISVAALNGKPGVFSARFAGEDASDEDNINKLLQDLVGTEDRRASFHCVAVAVFPEHDRDPLVASGEWPGVIAERRAGSGGFGYDPVFFDPVLGKCAADMTPDEKNARSHRGSAFRDLSTQLRDKL